MDSQNIKDLAQALCKAQAMLEEAKKEGTAKAGSFSYDYATLGSVMAACRAALSANGLSVIQSIGYDGDVAYLKTILLHTSGQHVASTCPLINLKGDMQGLGSAITYARRYSLAAIVGIVQEDDDAHSAIQKPVERPVAKPVAKPVQRPLNAEPNIPWSKNAPSPSHR